MKKIVAIIVAAGLLAALLPAPVSAGDRGWATAGKILTGVIGLHILGHALSRPYYYPEPAYAPPPPPYYPPEQVFVPGHYETRFERRWVPGHWEIARDDDDYGERYRARRVWIPGHYRDVEVRVWIPGHWEG